MTVKYSKKMNEYNEFNINKYHRENKYRKNFQREKSSTNEAIQRKQKGCLYLVDQRGKIIRREMETFFQRKISTRRETRSALDTIKIQSASDTLLMDDFCRVPRSLRRFLSLYA